MGTKIRSDSNQGDFIIFGGSSNNKLSEKVANHLGVDLGKCKIGKFPDGETRIEVLNSVRGKDVFIVQSTSSPVNDNLMELMLTISTIRKASAQRITAVIPYYGYARQD